jgi:hypothetical protein
MKILKQTGVISLLLLMIISSLGISFYLHNCSCSGDTTIGLGTESSDHNMGSCCTSCTAGSENNHHEPAFTKKGCCENRIYFYLLPVAPDHAVKYLSSLTEKILFNSISVFIADTTPDALGESSPLIHDPPAQRSGKLLIYFIRQIKIPFSAC